MLTDNFMRTSNFILVDIYICLFITNMLSNYVLFIYTYTPKFSLIFLYFIYLDLTS